MYDYIHLEYLDILVITTMSLLVLEPFSVRKSVLKQRTINENDSATYTAQVMSPDESRYTLLVTHDQPQVRLFILLNNKNNEGYFFGYNITICIYNSFKRHNIHKHINTCLLDYIIIVLFIQLDITSFLLARHSSQSFPVIGSCRWRCIRKIYQNHQWKSSGQLCASGKDNKGMFNNYILLHVSTFSTTFILHYHVLLNIFFSLSLTDFHQCKVIWSEQKQKDSTWGCSSADSSRHSQKIDTQ